MVCLCIQVCAYTHTQNGMLCSKKKKKLSGECMLLGSLSRHSKDLEWRTLKPPQHVTALRSQMDRVIALRQISVTALFYLEDSRKIHLQSVRARRTKDVKRRAPQRAGERERERERELALAPFFICFFFFFLGLSYVNWASQECCLFYLRSSLRSLDLPLF